MFETQQFQDELKKIINNAAVSRHLARYQNRAYQFLQDLAIANESDLMTEELKKSAGVRRGMREALQSAESLAQEAADYAVADNRDILTVDDIQKAYQAKFCRVWPFCK